MTEANTPTALKKDVILLSFCQAMMTSTNSLVIACSALVGVALSGDPLLGTLPAALQHIFTMLSTYPASALMGKLGRRIGFALAAMIGISGGLLGWYAIVHHSYWLFCVAVVLLGMHNGFGNYFRFAAGDAVEVSVKNRAISYVLAGGVLAAILGPNLANWTRTTVADAPFAGSFLAVSVLYVLALLAVSQLRIKPPVKNAFQTPGRPLREIVAQPVYRVAVFVAVVGFALMVLLMTATPLAMHAVQYPFSDTALVIQFHVLAMFTPSFVTGDLIERFGIKRMMGCGVLCGLSTVLVALAGTDFWNFFIALILLGLSWNFLFVSATSLLTECYRPEEKSGAQAFNDIAVFSAVGLCAFGAGPLQSFIGWGLLCAIAIPGYLLAAWVIWRLPSKAERTAMMQLEP